MVKHPFKVVVGLLALGTAVPASAYQYAEMDFQFVAPVSATKYLTGSFHKVSANEIVLWLNSQNISVTADPGVFSKMRLVTVTVMNAPVDKAMKKIGEAMGGTFVERSDAWIFKPNRVVKKSTTTTTTVKTTTKTRYGSRSTSRAVCSPAHRAPVKF